MGCGCKTIAAPRTFFVEGSGAVREVTGLVAPVAMHQTGSLATDAPAYAAIGVGAILMGKALGWMGVALVGAAAIPLVLLWREVGSKQTWKSTNLAPAPGQTAP